MKNSNLEPLRGSIHIKHGFPFKGEYFSESGEYIVLTPGNFYDKGGFKYTPGKEKFYSGEIPEDYLSKKGDLIVAMTEQTPGLLGSSALVPENNKFLHNQRIGLVSVDETKFDKTFLNYLFQVKYVRDQIALTSTGSKVKHTSPERIYDTLVIRPELKAQQQIGHILSAIDSKIDLNNQINEELEAMAKLIYDYWFVQFDFPMSAEQAAAMGKPELEGQPYKAAGGPMVYNTELKREIPEGWEYSVLSDLADITTGKLDSNAERKGGQYPFFTCAKFPALIDDYGYDDTVLLIAGNNASGNFHLNRYSGKFNAYQRTYILTSKNKEHLEHIYQVLRKELVKLKNQGNGSQTKFLTISMLTQINVLKEANGIIEQFSKIVSPMYGIQSSIQKQNQELTSLRDWLLPMLMNGQVKVAEAEEMVEAV